MSELNQRFSKKPFASLWARYYLHLAMRELYDQSFSLDEIQDHHFSDFKHHKEHRYTLSHNPDLLALWIWQKDQYHAAGIDIEWCRRPHHPRLLSYIRHEKDDTDEYSAIEVFCLKEASLKCLHHLDSLQVKPKALTQIFLRKGAFYFDEVQGQLILEHKKINEEVLVMARAFVR